MPAREQLLQLVRAGRSYEEIGERFNIHPGQAYMIVTGLPADGSDVLAPEDLDGRAGLLEGSTQHLANPPTVVPTHDPAVEAWVKARARGDGAMQRAAAARDAEPAGVQGADETDDVISAIGWDHNQVNALLEQAEAIPGVSKGGSVAQQRQRVSIVDMVRVRLSQHETAEEEHFWPAVRRSLPDGDALADRAMAQEQQGKDLLEAMDGVPGDDRRFDEMFEKLVLALRKHVAFEDKVLLAFSEAVPKDERDQVGRRFLSAKSHAPTRPHPHAPENPTALKAAAALAGPLDRARDALSERPATEKGRPVDGEGPGKSGAPDSERKGGDK